MIRSQFRTERNRIPYSVLLLVGPAVAGLRFPCRLVYTLDEPDRQGFTYGTSPGHPERG